MTKCNIASNISNFEEISELMNKMKIFSLVPVPNKVVYNNNNNNNNKNNNKFMAYGTRRFNAALTRVLQ